jgi:hypothetical protein
MMELMLEQMMTWHNGAHIKTMMALEGDGVLCVALKNT